MTGRPTKLTPETQELILKAIRAGNTLEVAAKYAGIDESTFYDWMVRGRNGEKLFSEFSESVTQARAQAEVRLVGLVSKAGEDDWRAAEAILKRGFRKNWGDTQRMEVTGKDGAPICVIAAPATAIDEGDFLKQIDSGATVVEAEVVDIKDVTEGEKE